jgi:hypothetical protein
VCGANPTVWAKVCAVESRGAVLLSANIFVFLLSVVVGRSSVFELSGVSRDGEGIGGLVLSSLTTVCASGCVDCVDGCGEHVFGFKHVVSEAEGKTCDGTAAKLRELKAASALRFWMGLSCLRISSAASMTFTFFGSDGLGPSVAAAAAAH